MELKALREAEGKLRLREKELLGRITKIEEKLEQADEQKQKFETDLKRVNRNLKATKTRLNNKLKVKENLIASNEGDLDFLRDSIASLKDNLVATRKNESDFAAQVKEKTIELNRIENELYDTKENLKTTKTNLKDVTRIKEMQDATTVSYTHLTLPTIYSV